MLLTSASGTYGATAKGQKLHCIVPCERYLLLLNYNSSCLAIGLRRRRAMHVPDLLRARVDCQLKGQAGATPDCAMQKVIDNSFQQILFSSQNGNEQKQHVLLSKCNTGRQSVASHTAVILYFETDWQMYPTELHEAKRTVVQHAASQRAVALAEQMRQHDTLMWWSLIVGARRLTHDLKAADM